MIAQLKASKPHPRRTRCCNRPANVERSSEYEASHAVMAQLSHELRNSLAVIRNAMHVLKMGAAENPAQEDARMLMARQLGHMTRLVDDLLDVSRMRTGRLQLRCARIDLCIPIAHAIRAVELTMHEREHRMTVSFPEMPVWLDGDAARLEQIFVNLLMNAAKYTNVGGDISLSVTQEAHEAVVILRDTGVGIAAELLPKVFDPYVQANPSSRMGGLGLGLPLVRALVECHGGSVTAASEGIGHGSQFTVRLPAFARP